MIRVVVASLMLWGCPMVDDSSPVPPDGDGGGEVELPCELTLPGCPEPHEPEVIASPRTPQRLPAGFTDRQGNTSWR